MTIERPETAWFPPNPSAPVIGQDRRFLYTMHWFGVMIHADSSERIALPQNGIALKIEIEMPAGSEGAHVEIILNHGVRLIDGPAALFPHEGRRVILLDARTSPHGSVVLDAMRRVELGISKAGAGILWVGVNTAHMLVR